MKNGALKPQFVSQYFAVTNTVEEHTGIRQGDIAKANARLASRGTILTRLKELVEAGVIERAYGFGPPSEVRYQIKNTAPLDALTGTKTAAQPVVEPEELNEEDAAIRDAVRHAFNCSVNKWLSFEYLMDECGDGSLDQMHDILQDMVEDGILVSAINNDEELEYYRYSYRFAQDRRWQRKEEQPVVAPVQASFADRVADFLRAADKPWQSSGVIGRTFGIDAETVDSAMNHAYDEDPTRFRANNVNPKTKKAFDRPNPDTVRCYALTERVEQAAPAPVEAPQSVERPVDAPAVVEAPETAPTPSLTLRDIIEQAVAQAVELTRRENEARIAELTADRDNLRELAETAQARFAAAESYMLSMRELAMKSPL